MDFRLKTIHGDITKIPVHVIVNAANSSLLGGGGVDGMIHHAAGPELLEECKTLGGCKTGKAKYTKAYNLPAQYVIHAVGPIYGRENGKEETLLANCYKNSLNIVNELKLESISFPCISTGVFHFPKKPAARIAIQTVKEYLSKNHTNIKKVIFVTYDGKDLRLYENELKKYQE
jgi:O-acetyl-ADP-ribose deacetylase (regulator of RNase III)